MSSAVEAPAKAHVLYRMYDRDDALLYVGTTCDVDARWKLHGRKKSWWPEVANIRVEHFLNRQDALAAERLAILAERPRHNVQHRPRGRPRSFILNPLSQTHRRASVTLTDEAWEGLTTFAGGRTKRTEYLRRMWYFAARNEQLLISASVVAAKRGKSLHEVVDGVVQRYVARNRHLLEGDVEED